MTEKRLRFKHLPACLQHTYHLQPRRLLHHRTDRTVGVRHYSSTFTIFRHADTLNRVQAGRNRHHHPLHLLPHDAPFRETHHRPLFQSQILFTLADTKCPETEDRQGRQCSDFNRHQQWSSSGGRRYSVAQESVSAFGRGREL